MAEVNIPEKESSPKRSRKKMPKIDMTPMVDLGFLLITFFMFTTNFLQPNIMDLGLPPSKPGPIKEIDALNQVTFILGKDNRIFYYQQDIKSLKKSDLKETSYEGVEIAKLINSYKKVAPKPEFFTIIVKPTDESNYQNFVDVLDQIAISKNERYGITDLKENEEKIYEEITK